MWQAYEDRCECEVNERNELSLVRMRGRADGIVYAEIASRHGKHSKAHIYMYIYMMIQEARVEKKIIIT